jgi:hypothetical protein
MDHQSPEFTTLLSSLTANANRASTIKLSDADAVTTLNVMDEVCLVLPMNVITYIMPPSQMFRNGRIPGKCERDTLYTMRKLAHNSGQVPIRYRVNRRPLCVEEKLVASGAFAEVRKGRLDRTVVAIKVLRVDQKADRKESQKVRITFGHFFEVFTKWFPRPSVSARNPSSG